MTAARWVLAWALALLLLVWRRLCRYEVHNDPRPALRAMGRPYAYALLHAHQVAAVFCNDERDLAAMVSRSTDGDLLVPSLRVRRVRAVRGSSRRGNRDKGGRSALRQLAQLALERVPVLLAVDGPRGPRGHVHRGVVDLAQQTRAAILPVAIVASRSIVLPRTWDRFQIPKPFSTVRLIFGEPLDVGDASEPALLRVRTKLSRALSDLERRHDPKEWPHVARHWSVILGPEDQV